jgi:ketosteroid isomerase-like protein
MIQRKVTFVSRGMLITGILVITIALVSPHEPLVIGQSGEEEAVRAVLLKSASSFEKNDMAAATQVWANDESLTVFENGHANYGWTDYRDNHLGSEMREMKNTSYAFSEMKIHPAGKTAWATFTYRISADVGKAGKSRHVDGSGLGTAVLENRNGQWRIVHWHSSAPRRAPAAAPTPPSKP